MNKGSNQNYIYLFQFFKLKSNFIKIGIQDQLVKLIPSAALKTQDLAKNFNKSIVMKGMKIDDKIILNELKIAVLNFWENIQTHLLDNLQNYQFKAIPKILFYFTYVNLLEEKFQKIFTETQNIISENIKSFDQKQLSQIVYSYGRMNKINFTDVLMKIVPMIEVQEDLISSVNVYWGLQKQKIRDLEINQKIENQIFKNST